MTSALKNGLLKDRLVLVWAALVVATLVSYLAGHDHSAIGEVGVVVALLIAFLKVRFVGIDFMELKGAPPALRAAFEAWCVLVAGMVVVLYLIGSA
jgi:hypothetical protein